jgi:hypothetical protein
LLRANGLTAPPVFETSVTQLDFSPDVSEFIAVSALASKLRLEETQDTHRGVQFLHEFIKVGNLTMKQAKHSTQSRGSIPDSLDVLLLRKACNRVLFECFFHPVLLTAIMSGGIDRYIHSGDIERQQRQ